MTPKEKAEELYIKFLPYCKASWNAFTGLEKMTMSENAKQCALISVKEILKTDPSLKIYSTYDKLYNGTDYWNEVKAEIEKL